MKSRVSVINVGICLMLVLPGCGRIIDWGKNSFNQVEQVNQFSKIPQQYIRSVKAYDQWSTRAIFDVLWLSKPVRSAYASAYAYKHGKSEDLRKVFLRRQLEENKHFISFYVLAPHAYSLGEKNSYWTLFLEIDGNNYAPLQAKPIEISQEYQVFFGKLYNRFKTVYHVKFDAKDVEDRSLINPESKIMKLYFRSVKHEVALVWHLDSDHFTTQCEGRTQESGCA